MKRYRTSLGASLVLLPVLVGAPLQAGGRELATVEAATETLQAFAAIPLRGIPPALLQDAKGVAVIPDVVKAGFILGGRFGRGLILLRRADGGWSNPVFITLAGGSLGWQVGVQATDVVLVFKTRNSLDPIVRGKGKLTLGADVGVAVGPVGRQAEAGTDAQLKAEIYSYSRSRGLFVGLSLEGAGLLVDCEANEAFYGVRGGRPADVLALCGVPIPVAVVALQAQLARMAPPPLPPPVLLPPQTPPPVVPPPASPPPDWP
jgi:lipid-binding SYLF domain-containing protein